MAAPGVLSPAGNLPSSAPAFGVSDSSSQAYVYDEDLRMAYWSFTAPAGIGKITFDALQSTDMSNAQPEDLVAFVGLLYLDGTAVSASEMLVEGSRYSQTYVLDGGQQYWVQAYGATTGGGVLGPIKLNVRSSAWTPITFNLGAGEGTGSDSSTTPPGGALKELFPGQWGRTRLVGGNYFGWYEVVSPSAGYLTLDGARDVAAASYLYLGPVVAGEFTQVAGGSFTQKAVFKVSAGARRKIAVSLYSGRGSLSVSDYMTATPWVGGETVEEIWAAHGDQVNHPGDKVLGSARMGTNHGMSGASLGQSSVNIPVAPFNPSPEHPTQVLYAGPDATETAFAHGTWSANGGRSAYNNVRNSLSDWDLGGRAAGYASYFLTYADWNWKSLGPGPLDGAYWITTKHVVYVDKRYMYYEYRLEPQGGAIQGPLGAAPNFATQYPNGFVMESTGTRALLKRAWFSPDERPIPEAWTEPFEPQDEGWTFTDLSPSPSFETLPSPARPLGLHWGVFPERRTRTTSGTYYMNDNQDDEIALMSNSTLYEGGDAGWHEIDPAGIAAGTWFRTAFEPLEDYEEWAPPPGGDVSPGGGAFAPTQHYYAAWAERLLIGLPSISFKAEFEMPAYRAIPYIDLPELPPYMVVVPEIDDSGPYPRAYFS